MQTKIEEATSERVKAQHNLDHWRQKLQEEADKLATLEQAAAVLQEEYEVRTKHHSFGLCTDHHPACIQDWTKKAEDYCDGLRIDSPRESDELDRLIKSSENALRDQERA